MNHDESAMCALSEEEMKRISGGGLADMLFKFAVWGAGYFYNMGVQEARKMKALL